MKYIHTLKTKSKMAILSLSNKTVFFWSVSYYQHKLQIKQIFCGHIKLWICCHQSRHPYVDFLF